MVDSTPVLPGLSPLFGKRLDARFDGGRLSSDGGVIVLREVEERLGLSGKLAACLPDPRHQARCTHTLADIIRFRVMAIAAGYEDGNDCDSLRVDPAFKLAVGRGPETGKDLCSQPTISRLENLPSRTALYRLGRAMLDQYCASYRTVPTRITLDIDDTFDAVHGGQQLRLFNAHHDEYGFQPIVIFDDSGRPVTAILRPAKRPKGTEIVTLLKRVIGRICEAWPRVKIMLRGDGHYACPEVLDWCEQEGIDFVLGLPGTTTLHRHVEGLCARTKALHAAAVGTDPKRAATLKTRRFTDFYDGARSWSRTRRIIARVEAGEQGVDVRYVVTNLQDARPKTLYERTYCERGQMENFIKSYKTHLAADRTSCHSANANQFRLILHMAAYWLLWGLRSLAPKKSIWRTAQFDTIRLRLLKIAARIDELRTVIRIRFPSSCPVQPILRCLAERTPRLLFLT